MGTFIQADNFSKITPYLKLFLQGTEVTVRSVTRAKVQGDFDAEIWMEVEAAGKKGYVSAEFVAVTLAAIHFFLAAIASLEVAESMLGATGDCLACA